MANRKAGKAVKSSTNRQVAARLAYLQNAAKYLTRQHTISSTEKSCPQSTEVKAICDDQLGSSRHLNSHMRAISRKAQSRLPQDIKRSICKRCNTTLIPETTSKATVENKSRHSRKPWADVKIVTCRACGTSKRFPEGARRQLPKAQRTSKAGAKSIRREQIDGNSGK